MTKRKRKPTTKDRLKDAFNFLNNLTSRYTHEQLKTYKGIVITYLVVSIVIFGYFYKNHFLLILTFLVGLFILIFLFALDSFIVNNTGVEEVIQQSPAKPQPPLPKVKEEEFSMFNSGITSKDLGLGEFSQEDYDKKLKEAFG